MGVRLPAAKLAARSRSSGSTGRPGVILAAGARPRQSPASLPGHERMSRTAASTSFCSTHTPSPARGRFGRRSEPRIPALLERWPAGARQSPRLSSATRDGPPPPPAYSGRRRIRVASRSKAVSRGRSTSSASATGTRARDPTPRAGTGGNEMKNWRSFATPLAVLLCRALDHPAASG